MTLYQDTDGDGNGNKVLGVVLTDANGQYGFSRLLLDDLDEDGSTLDTDYQYIIEVTDSQGVLTGYTPSPISATVVAVGDDSDNTSSVNYSRDHTGYEITLDSAGIDADYTADFGFLLLASIGDYIWNDANANGIQDAGEEGIDGTVTTVTVNLLDES